MKSIKPKSKINDYLIIKVFTIPDKNKTKSSQTQRRKLKSHKLTPRKERIVIGI